MLANITTKSIIWLLSSVIVVSSAYKILDYDNPIVIDGDTIIINNQRIRLYGIDAVVRHEVANKSYNPLKRLPSMLLDEPTILNKERIGQCSKV